MMRISATCCVHIVFCLLSLLGFSAACSAQGTLFRPVAAARSGLLFSNRITENDRLNILNEAYIYNGGGVGIGDFNRDSLPDLFFAGNMVPNRLYLNEGKLRFKDVSIAAGIDNGGRWSMGVSVVDINNDGWPDIYVAASFHADGSRRTNQLYINKGNNKSGVPVFAEAAAAYGIADDGYSTQGYFLDYDQDDDLDLFVLTNTLSDPKTPIQFRPKITDGSALGTDRLYRNNGNGTFTNVSREAGINIEGWGHAAAVSDFNGDGWPDIYVSNDFVANDICYINNRDGTFTDRITDHFKHTSWYTMGTDVADVNNDGLVDLVALDMLPETNLRKKGMMMGNEYYNYFNSRKYGYQHQYVRNVLQLNQGKAPNGQYQFSEVGILAGMYQTDWSWSPLVADFDNDGYRDLIITNGLPRDVTDLDYVAYDNGQGGGKVNTSLKMVDALPVVKIPNYAFRNKGGYQFEDVSKKWGITQPSFANGAAYADLDNDGDLDVVVNNINEVPSLFENTLSAAKPALRKHFLQLALHGPARNRDAVGTRVWIHYGKQNLLYQEQQPMRGYLSTVDARMHFGLDATAIVDSVVVEWPDKKVTRQYGVPADQLLHLHWNTAKDGQVKVFPGAVAAPLLRPANHSVGIRYRHAEKDAVDYNIQPTLPRKLSQFGPALAVGDINADGLEDCFIGGAAGNSGSFLVQDSAGHFILHDDLLTGIPSPIGETMGVLLFDADGDGDLDLYQARGSYELAPNHTGQQDILLLNNGAGRFTYAADALPQELANASCIKAADFDGDGDLDLFVGGRSVSGGYPVAPRSFLLENRGGKFTDVTNVKAPVLERPGMVSDALWTDFDNDGRVDLVLCGDWMGVQFYRNTGAALVPAAAGTEQYKGWWNSLVAADFDGDGDMDYVAGNLGLNSVYKATPAEPMVLLSKDIDQNGKIDPMIFCYGTHTNGSRQLFPMHTKDDLTTQLISIRKQYPTYRSFGKATIDSLWPAPVRKGALELRANHMASSYFENQGNGSFKIRPLPVEAQVAPVYGMLATDLDGDHFTDLLLSGNDFGMEPGSGRHDAGNGLVLKGDGKGGFKPLTLPAAGFYVPGDGKALVALNAQGGQSLFLASQNQDSLLAFAPSVAPVDTGRYLVLAADDFLVTFQHPTGESVRLELYHGSSFLGQSSRRVAVPKNVERIFISKYNGTRRELLPSELKQPGHASTR